MSNEPKPIDNETLPSLRQKALPCWQFNSYLACDRYGSCRDAVKQVWATKYALYRIDPRSDGFASGSQTVGILYRTESEAWQACIAEVERMHEKRMVKLRELAEDAQ
ncbi:MAG: hypothetical protein ACX94C_07845 [Phycisphaerales bacterium]